MEMDYLTRAVEWSTDAVSSFVLEIAFLDEKVHYIAAGAALGLGFAWILLHVHIRAEPKLLQNVAQNLIKDTLFKTKQSLRTLQLENVELRTNKARVERELSDALTRASALRSELATSQQQQQQQHQQQQQQQQQPLSHTASSSLKMELANNSLESSVVEWKTRALRMESLLAGMEEHTEAELARMREEMLRKGGELERAQQATQLLQSQLDATNGKLAAVQTQNYLLQAELQVTSDKQFMPPNVAELIEKNAEMNEIKSKNAILVQENQASLSKISALRSSEQDLISAKKSQEMEIYSLRAENVRLRNQILASAKTADAQKDELDALTNRCEDLQRQVLRKEGSSANVAAANGGGYAGSIATGATTMFDSTVGVLSAPIVLLAGGMGAGAATPSQDAKLKVKKLGLAANAYEDDDEVVSPSGTSTPSKHSTKNDVCRTHEKLKQRDKTRAPPLSPRRDGGSSSTLFGGGGKDGETEESESGVLGTRMVALAGNGNKTPTKAKFAYVR